MLLKDALYYSALIASMVNDKMIMNFELVVIKGALVVCYRNFRYKKIEERISGRERKTLLTEPVTEADRSLKYELLHLELVLK
jgi:hypothetical protein